jgi:hypothetical protein
VVLRTAMLLDWRASLDELKPDVLIWNDFQQHLIRGGRLVGYSEADVQLVLGRAA